MDTSSDILSRIKVRIVAMFANSFKIIVEKLFLSCRSNEVVLSQGDRQVSLVKHYYWDSKNGEFCLGIFKIDPEKEPKHYKRCIRY